MIIKLYKQGKTIREIAPEVHVSFREIGRVIRRSNGEKESKVTNNRTKAYSLFSDGKAKIKVAISLGLGYEEVKQYYFEFLSLNNMDNIVRMLIDHEYYLPFLYQAVERIKSNGLSEHNVISMIDNMGDIRAFVNREGKVQHEVNMLILKREDLLKFRPPE